MMTTTTKETAMSASEEQIARLNAGNKERLERMRDAEPERERDDASGDKADRMPSASERQVAQLTASQIRPKGRASQIQAEMLGYSS
jgi:hypothetical protein